MKLKYIIGILVCLLAMAGTASAMNLVSKNGLTNETVTVTFSTTNYPDDTVTFTVSPASGQPAGWFSKVGYNVVPSTLSVSSITDNKNNGWTYKGYKVMDGFGSFYEYDIDNQDHDVNTVTIVFSGTITDTDKSTFAAHAQWGTGSDFFGPEGTTPIPEFPTIALPVAAVIGIMFIVGSRKKE
ncbi:PEF-CTERM sorting domain-containing protein [Methanosarcina sp.]|uniref:PEF-CTERM sorting domain-containing protein n=1 Tax=Methanosarcina sp. TaxID=2213 RepID=UPI002C0DEB06|nr:PEF-CTERM sorting domain-containing protein [Methanosarcina sp.]HOW13964.1 PEF-CTERM sorting domain-containing protein [Methanosarcina sp.]